MSSKKLTRKQTEVYALLVQGISYSEIAKDMEISKNGVSAIVSRICKNLEVPSKEMAIVDYYKKLLNKAGYKVILKNWSIKTDGNPFVSPELLKYRLTGEVYNHPRFEDGKSVSTSTLKSIDYKNQKVQTRNTEYHLEEPNEDWLKYLKGMKYDVEKYLKQEKFECIG